MVAKCDNNELLKRMHNIIIITNTTPIETAESKEISLNSENAAKTLLEIMISY